MADDDIDLSAGIKAKPQADTGDIDLSAGLKAKPPTSDLVNQAIATIPSPKRLLDVAAAYPGSLPSKVPVNWAGTPQQTSIGLPEIAGAATGILAPGTFMPGRLDAAPDETVGTGIREMQTPGRRLTGALRTVAGGTEALAPIAGPLAVENPLRFMLGAAEGYATGKGAKAVAGAAGADEEQKQLIDEIGQMAPILYHALLHPEMAQGHTPEGNPVIQGTVRGQYGAGVEITPDEFIVRGGSAKNPKEIRIPRRPQAPTIEAPTIEGQPAAGPPQHVGALGQVSNEPVESETPALTSGQGLIGTVARALAPRYFSTAEQLATEAFRPRNAKSDWQMEISSALHDMKRGAQSLGLDANNVSLVDAKESGEKAQQSVWAEYEHNFLSQNEKNEQSTQSVADAIRATVTPRIAEQNPALANEIARVASTYDNRTLNVRELQQRVTELNNETRAIEAKYAVDQAAAKLSPDNAYKFAERDKLRGLLDKAMDQSGPAAANLRRRYGALTSVIDVISRRIPVADRASKMPLTRALSLTAAGAQFALGLITLNPGLAAGGIVPLLTEAYIRHISDPNNLVKQAFRKTEATPPWTPYQAPQPPPAPLPQPTLPPGQYEMQPSPLGPIFRSRQPQIGQGAEPPGRQPLLPAAAPHQLPPSSLAPPAINPNFPRIGRPQRAPEAVGGGLPPTPEGSLESRPLVSNLPATEQAVGRGGVTPATAADIAEAERLFRNINNVPAGTLLESRPLSVAPPPPDTQLDLGLNLPRRGEPFFSKAEQVAEAKLPKSGPGDSFLSTLRNSGVKAEEISDLGLDAFASKPKVTKQEFLEAIRSRRPQLSQTVLEGPDTRYEDYTTPGGRAYREILTQYPRSEMGAMAERLTAEADEMQRQMDEEIDRHNAASPEEQAAWPDDYFDNARKEIKLMRDRAADAKRMAAASESQSSHWPDNPNVIMHQRESDFVTTDGMPVRHSQEVQSDLHQRGREIGYRTEPLRQLPEGYRTKAMDGGGYQVLDQNGRIAVSPRGESATFPSARSPEDAIDGFLGQHNAAIGDRRGAPNAPFKKSWHELAIKDSIRRAIEDRRSGLTWDTGETQADRYDLSKQISRVEYDPHTEKLTAWDSGGKEVVDESASPEELPNYLGKEAAEKLQHQIDNYYPVDESDYSIHTHIDEETGEDSYEVMDANGESLGFEDTRPKAKRLIEELVNQEREYQSLPSLKGLDLKVGGEGMSGFYDKILPDFVRKYTKKWGAKVDTAELPTGEVQKEHEYVGPELTKDEVEQRWKAASRTGPMEWKETPGGAWAWFQDGKQISGAFHDASESRTAAQTISNDPIERQWKNILDDMNRGVPFKDAMAHNWNLAEEVGGKIQTNETPVTTKVHRLTFTPEMVRAIQEEGQPLYSRETGGGAAEAPDLTVGNAIDQLRNMRTTVDLGDENTAAHIRINPAGQKFLSRLSGSDWKGISWEGGGPDIAQRTAAYRAFADSIERFAGGAEAAKNLRTFADHIDAVNTANAGVDGSHAGIPIVRDASALAHERDIHGGQRVLDPERTVANFTNVEKTVAHPAVPIAREKLNAAYGRELPDHEVVAEMQAHILDGNHAELGLTPEQAIDWMKHSRDVLYEHHGPEVMANAPRLSRRYLQAMNDYVEGADNASESAEPTQPQTAQAQTEEAQRTGAGGGAAENARPGEYAQGAVGRGNRALGARQETRVGDPETARLDNLYWNKAKEALGPSASFSQISAKALDLKAKAAAAGTLESHLTTPTETPQFKRWFGDSKTVDEDGQPQVLYHGTTHVFDRFSPERGNSEGHYGKGFYFTDDPHDVSTNYAGKGPDLTNRIETLAEQLQSEDERLTPSQAQQLAEERLQGPGGHVMPTYVKMENPVDVRPGGGTEFKLHYDEDTGEESGNAVDLWKATNEVAREYGLDGQKLWGKTMAEMESPTQQYFGYNKPPRRYPGYDTSDFTAHAFERALRRSAADEGVYDQETGHDATGELVRKIFQAAGFDGIKQDAYSEFGGARAAGKPMEMAPGTSHYIAFEPNQVKSAIANQGTFNPESSSILESRKLEPPAIPSFLRTRGMAETIPGRPANPFEDTEGAAETIRRDPMMPQPPGAAEAAPAIPDFLRQPEGALESRPLGEEHRISTRRPTAVNATEDPMRQDLQINTQAIRDAGLEKGMATQLRAYPGPRLTGNSTEVLDNFRKNAASNLVWLHNQLPENFRQPSQQWYDGANQLAGDWSKRYGIEQPQVAGVIASLSPRKDWHMNVSLAQRVIETYTEKQNAPFSSKMKAEAQRLAASVPSLKPLLKEIAGKKLSDLSDPTTQAMWVRLYDEANNPRSYNVYAPDGSRLDIARNVDGQPSRVAWTSIPMIAKALSILADGSRQNISDQLGNMHKIRSFFNNIIAPNSTAGDVTIDTHAVAAALLRALSGEDVEVSHNFGTSEKGTPGVGQSRIKGVMGSYGLYADAYRDAARKLDLLPRQLQSITWEGIRSLFPAEYKTEANKGIIDGIWKDYRNGHLTLSQARRQIVKAAGGFTPPEWARGGSSAGDDEAAGNAAQPENVSGAGVPGRSSRSFVGGGGGNAPAPVPEVVPSFLRSPRSLPPSAAKAPMLIPKFLRKR